MSIVGHETVSEFPDLADGRTVAERIGIPFESWHARCHEISLAIVRAGLIPHARVARGWCDGVRGQHSWIVCPRQDDEGETVLGDCYAPNAMIVDPTLWTYRPDVHDIYIDEAAEADWHEPHGQGQHIMDVGRPDSPIRPTVKLAPGAFERLSDDARVWVVDAFGPLDVKGWHTLAHMTVVGWPSDEIIAAMWRTPELRAIVPIDRVGMLTALNPGGLYLHDDDAESEES